MKRQEDIGERNKTKLQSGGGGLQDVGHADVGLQDVGHADVATGRGGLSL
ncbi:hypothetical protein JOE23_002581 [Amphibacillus cookii]|nr:hypothetical protein [Amphibacillus cookii]